MKLRVPVGGLLEEVLVRLFECLHLGAVLTLDEFVNLPEGGLQLDEGTLVHLEFHIELLFLLLQLFQLDQIRTVLPHVPQFDLQLHLFVLGNMAHLHREFLLVNDIRQLIKLHIELIKNDLLYFPPLVLLVAINLEQKLVLELVHLKVVLSLL